MRSILYVSLWLLVWVSVLPGLARPMSSDRVTLVLNGTWEFEQTMDDFPPKGFSRRIPVPGLIHLAQPRIDQYEELFSVDEDNVTGVSGNPYESPYRPRTNWYRRMIHIDETLRGRQAVLTISKSKYVTDVYVNRIKVGTSISCYTPIDCEVTRALKWGQSNEILIRVGDRAWLPSEAPGSTDKEKVNYLPGIWDDVSLSFTGPFRLHRVLLLPSIAEEKVKAKLLLKNSYLAQIDYGDPKEDSCQIQVQVLERKSGRAIGPAVSASALISRDRLTEVQLDLPVKNPRLWCPEDPFLYQARITISEDERVSDSLTESFGMREFGRRGRHFTLNGKKIILRGTNVTLHRFFEDPDCQALPWTEQWVRKLLDDIPKQVNWNAMRICVGIAPKLWYEIADEAGLLLQNEWLYWQTHGWDDELRKEYTDWLWTDGSHPSIVIWDAINENWDEYVGNKLIPELRELDPTRIWDAGYMTEEHMGLDEMDEPHPYMAGGHRDSFDAYKHKQQQNPYDLGDLDNWSLLRKQDPSRLDRLLYSSAAQLVNEYGWIWLWRDGRPAKLTHNQYRYFLNNDLSPEANRHFQAYWLQLETEWLRAERSLAGVLAFCYLTNNYGHTGDWFVGDIKDLEAGPTLEWFKHCFAPTAVFIDLTDQRYTKHTTPFPSGSRLSFNLIGVNDESESVSGKVEVQLRNAQDRIVLSQQIPLVVVPAYSRTTIPVTIELPETKGGYLMVASFQRSDEAQSGPVVSRRYLKVGEATEYAWGR